MSRKQKKEALYSSLLLISWAPFAWTGQATVILRRVRKAGREEETKHELKADDTKPLAHVAPQARALSFLQKGDYQKEKKRL